MSTWHEREGVRRRSAKKMKRPRRTPDVDEQGDARMCGQTVEDEFESKPWEKMQQAMGE